MLRTICAIGFAVLYLILGIPVLGIEYLIGKKNPHLRDISSLRLVQWAFRVINRICGVRLTVIGHENVPADQAVLYVANHNSYFDIIITYALCPGLTGYISKDTLGKVPLLNIWMRRLYCLFMNRDDMKQSLKVILQLFPNAKGVFGIEDNKPDCIAKLSELTASESRMEVVPLMTKYPQGGERQLIYAVTGRSINSKMLPADAGCIVDNVETMVAVYNAVRWGRPLMNRIFTVTGDAVCEPRNFYISVGTSYKELLEAAGGLVAPAKKMISGGPMMGFALFDLDVPITKTTSALLCMTEDEASLYETTACINCARCVEACPEQLIPSRLADYSIHGQKDMFEKWYGLECVECGSCSYVCPARRPLAQAVKTMKKEVLADKRKKK